MRLCNWRRIEYVLRNKSVHSPIKISDLRNNPLRLRLIRTTTYHFRVAPILYNRASLSRIFNLNRPDGYLNLEKFKPESCRGL